MMALFYKKLWLAKEKGKQGGEPPEWTGERHTAHFLPNVRRLAGDRGDRMSPFCSQLVGVGVGWRYC